MIEEINGIECSFELRVNIYGILEIIKLGFLFSGEKIIMQLKKFYLENK